MGFRVARTVGSTWRTSPLMESWTVARGCSCDGEINMAPLEYPSLSSHLKYIVSPTSYAGGLNCLDDKLRRSNPMQPS
eukprot:14087316-Ditylum_brightwellii.AAC.1